MVPCVYYTLHLSRSPQILVIYCWPNSQINYLALWFGQIQRNSYLVKRKPVPSQASVDRLHWQLQTKDDRGFEAEAQQTWTEPHAPRPHVFIYFSPRIVRRHLIIASQQHDGWIDAPGQDRRAAESERRTHAVEAQGPPDAQTTTTALLKVGFVEHIVIICSDWLTAGS